MIPPYPLAWPEGLPRTDRPKPGQFKTTLAKAIDNVEDSLRRFAADTRQKITDVQVTSNKAGLTNAQPKDVGVSVWFEWDGEPRCIAVDQYDKLEHNVQAIHHIIEARRTELRHGGLNIVRQTFRSFIALPPPPPGAPQIGSRNWRDVLGFGPNRKVSAAEISERYRSLAKERAGDEATLRELNIARDQAREECEQ